MHEDKNTIIDNDNKKITIFRIRHLFEFLKIGKYNKMIIKSTTGQLKIIKSSPIPTPSIFYFLWPLKVIDMKFNKHVYFIVCIMRLIFCLRQSTIKNGILCL